MAIGHKRAVGTFPTRQAADQAITELRQSGFSMDHVSVISKDHDRVAGMETTERVGNKADDGAKAGAATGGAVGGVGGLLVGLGLLAIPGIGPVMLAGAAGTAIATALSGAAIGAAAGGLGGALIGLGIPEGEAKRYNDAVNEGGYLVVVEGTDAEIARAAAIFNRHGVRDWNVYGTTPQTTAQTTTQAVAAPIAAPIETSAPLETSAALPSVGVPAPSARIETAKDDDAVRLYEERLVADKQRAKTGEVAIGKHIETQTERVDVTVERERVVIERIDTPNTAVAPGEANFGEGTVRVEVYEEVPDIQKETFVREEVQIRKEVDREVAKVEDTIRREELDVDVDGNPIVQSPSNPDLRR